MTMIKTQWLFSCSGDL